MSEFKTKPYAHQLKALDASWDKEYFGLLMDMGTGKTWVAINTICRLWKAGRITGALVIAPKGMCHQWASGDPKKPQEWETHAPDWAIKEAQVYNWTTSDSEKNKRIQQYLTTVHDGFDLVVMNTEAFSTERGLKFALKFMKAHRAVVTVDEATLIRNPKARRTKAIQIVGGLAPHRRILSGTLVANSPLDVFAPMAFLHNSILGGSYYAFRARYAVLKDQFLAGGRSFKTVVGYKNLEDLQYRLSRHTFRVTKDECLDLPPKVYVKYECPMGAQQARLYKQMKEMALAELDGVGLVTAPLAITKMQRLRQIACGLLPLEGEQHADGRQKFHLIEDSPRVDLLLDLLRETSSKVIIWASYRESVFEICRRVEHEFGPRSYIQYIGGMTSAQRLELQDRFNNDPACRYMAGTPATGKYGLNLVAANVMIYFDNDFDLDVRLQSEARFDRIGQKRKMTYADIVAPDTIDVKIREALLTKKQIATMVTGDKWREWIV